MTERRVLEWLLEEDQPSVRYLALTQLLGRGERDPEVRTAKENITRTGWVKDILGQQRPSGYWVHEKSLWTPSFFATNWMLLILSDLGATKEEPGVDRACKMWIRQFSKGDGGFSAFKGQSYSHLCITGNTTRALIRFGYADHPRVREAFRWLVENQAEKGGWSCWNFPGRRRGRSLDSWEPLSALAVYPRQKWTKSMKAACEKGAEFFLERELHEQGERHEPWYRFHYPIHYYYDVLVGLDFLTALGHSADRRLGFAAGLVREKRRPDGKWNLDMVRPESVPEVIYTPEGTPKDLSPFALERAGEPSKMITLTALKVLGRIDGTI